MGGEWQSCCSPLSKERDGSKTLFDNFWFMVQLAVIVTITGYDVKFGGIIIANKIFINGTNTEITNTVDLSKLEG